MIIRRGSVSGYGAIEYGAFALGVNAAALQGTVKRYVWTVMCEDGVTQATIMEWLKRAVALGLDDAAYRLAVQAASEALTIGSAPGGGGVTAAACKLRDTNGSWRPTADTGGGSNQDPATYERYRTECVAATCNDVECLAYAASRANGISVNLPSRKCSGGSTGSSCSTDASCGAGYKCSGGQCVKSTPTTGDDSSSIGPMIGLALGGVAAYFLFKSLKKKG